MPQSTVAITWTLPPEEHAFWLSQARECNLTVGEYIYVLASVHALERWGLGEAPASAQSLRAAWWRIQRNKALRLERRKG
jgi:hypothetical protein